MGESGGGSGGPVDRQSSSRDVNDSSLHLSVVLQLPFSKGSWVTKT